LSRIEFVHAFTVACLGYGAAEDFVAPARVTELPFMRGARFSGQAAMASQLPTPVRSSPGTAQNLTNKYREQLGECLAKIVLDTQAAHIMAKAREIHFQAEFVTAKLDDSKARSM